MGYFTMPYGDTLNVEATPPEKAGHPVKDSGLIFYQRY
jgi:hypothetical protein